MTDRRGFLKAIVAGTAGVTLSHLAARKALARSTPGSLIVTDLTSHLKMVSGAGGNVVVMKGSEGLILVDSGSAERARELLKLVGQLFDEPRIDTLFNTHWHWDHTGGNEQFAKLRPRILAHENTRLWLGAEIWQEWQDRTWAPRPSEAHPTTTFYTGGTETFGEEEIEYGHLGQAHTDGDIYVYFRKQNVLVAGDVLSVGSYPILDYSTGGWLGGMVTANERLLSLTNADTRLIPGSGPVQTRADLEAQHQMLSTMKDRLVDLMRKGIGTDDLVANPPTREFDARWGDPSEFLVNAYRGLWGHVRELGKIV